MSVSFDKAPTLQAAISHQCSRDADGNGEGGRNGYPSDSVEAALIRDKFDVVPSEDHDQMQEEASDSEETPCTSSGSDGEGVGTTGIHHNFYARQYICYSAYMPRQFRQSVCLSVRLSVCHTRVLYQNG